MNTAYSDLQVAAKTTGRKDSNVQKVTYQFLADFHGICVDKRDIFECEIRACELLLQYTKDVSERAVLEGEITELRAILNLLRQEPPQASVPQDMPAKKSSPRKAHFVICQDCFWCASCFKQDNLPECPGCSGRNIDLLPIFEGEHYQVEISKKHSVNLMFGKA